MGHIPGSWDFTMLAVHVGVVFCLISLWRRSPDWTQRFVIFSLIAGYAFFTADSLMLLFGRADAEADYNSPIWRIATAFEHVAVILYVARLWLQEQDDPCRNSLEHFRSSDRSSKSSA